MTRSIDRLGLGLLGGYRQRPTIWLPLDYDIAMASGGEAGTFVRASNGLYTHPDTGIITTVGNNVPRFEKVGGRRAILLEPAGTNLIQYSHELDDAWWSRIRLTSITANGMLAPDGNTVADGLVADANDDTHYIRSTKIVGIGTNDKVAVTAFARPGNKDWIRLRIDFYDAGDVHLAETSGYYFNVATGAVGSAIAPGDATIHDYMIEAAANGYYRVGIIVSSADATVAKVDMLLNSANANDDLDFPGDTTTVNTWLWGADLKKQAYFDSYVPTSGATATRATESGYPLWTLPTGLFDDTGTLSVWVRFGYPGSASPPTSHEIVSCKAVSQGFLFNDSGNQIYSYDATTLASKGLVWAANTWYKLVVKWGYGGKFRVGVDSGSGVSFGTEQNFDGSYTLGTNLRLAYGLFGPMWIRNLRLYGRVLMDSEIDALGSP